MMIKLTNTRMDLVRNEDGTTVSFQVVNPDDNAVVSGLERSDLPMAMAGGYINRFKDLGVDVTGAEADLADMVKAGVKAHEDDLMNTFAKLLSVKTERLGGGMAAISLYMNGLDDPFHTYVAPLNVVQAITENVQDPDGDDEVAGQEGAEARPRMRMHPDSADITPNQEHINGDFDQFVAAATDGEGIAPTASEPTEPEEATAHTSD